MRINLAFAQGVESLGLQIGRVLANHEKKASRFLKARDHFTILREVPHRKPRGGSLA